MIIFTFAVENLIPNDPHKVTVGILHKFKRYEIGFCHKQ